MDGIGNFETFKCNHDFVVMWDVWKTAEWINNKDFHVLLQTDCNDEVKILFSNMIWV